jgi:hypothetical protein
MIDGETSLKSLLYVTESLEQLIGSNGAKAVLRAAGQRAAVNLIEMLPLTLPEDQAARRAGLLLVELGFIAGMQTVEPDLFRIEANLVKQQLTELNLESLESGGYYVVGLFEGFFKQLSASRRRVVSVEMRDDGEYWKLG